MKFIVLQLLSEALSKLKTAGDLPTGIDVEICVERSREASHGDFATNLALTLAKPCQSSSERMASLLVEAIPSHALVERVETAGHGFINFFLKQGAMSQIIPMILNRKKSFGRSDTAQGQTMSMDHPFYTVQYAHARICSLLRQFAEQGLPFDEARGLAAVDRLSETHEKTLLTLLSGYREWIETAEDSDEFRPLADDLLELADSLHAYCNAVPLLCEDIPLRHARLCLLQAVRQVLNEGLRLSGVPVSESL